MAKPKVKRIFFHILCWLTDPVQLSIIAIVCGYFAAIFINMKLWYHLSGLVLFQIIIIYFNYQRKSRGNKEKVLLLTKFTYDMMNIDKNDDIRMVIHLKTSQDNRELQQYIDNYPDGGGEGRITDSSKGIIGLCFRECVTDKIHTWIPSEEECTDIKTASVKKWGFTIKEAADLKQDRKAYACLAIPEDDQIVGVIFMDSKNPQAFEDEKRIFKILDPFRKTVVKLLERG